jgi:hypothetical protein
MRSFIPYVLLLTGLSTPTAAQKLMFGVEANVGFYSMMALKQTQRLPANYPISFKSVQNFPATPGARVIVGIAVNDRISVGIFAGATETGSRLTYSDLTGHAYRDVEVLGTYIGSYNRFQFFTRGPWSAHARFSTGVIINTIEFQNRLHLQDIGYEEIQQSEWRTTNFFVDLGLEAGYSWKQFYVKAFGTYETGMAGNARLMRGSQYYPTDRKFIVEWDGLRVGVGLEYHLLKQKP